MNEGLMGVEVEYDYRFSGMHRTSDEVRHIIQYVDILRTGGSDYHGTVHYTELGSVTVPIEVIHSLERLRNEV